MTRTIETTGVMTPEHAIALKLPDEFPEGECQGHEKGIERLAHPMLGRDHSLPELAKLTGFSLARHRKLKTQNAGS